MAYIDVADMAKNGHLRERIAACAVSEGIRHMHPTAWADQNQWQLAGAPGWSEAWQHARVVGENEAPGRDEAVITDGMILSAVQAILAEEEAALNLPLPGTEEPTDPEGGAEA